MGITFHYSTAKDLLEKARRELLRLQNAMLGSDDEEIADSLFNFAVTSHHIADWLKQESPPLSSQIYGLIAGTPELLICKDLCNAGKHCEITKYDPVAKESYISAHAAVVFQSLSGRDVEIPNRRIKVKTVDGDTYEVLELCVRAFETWQRFIEKEVSA